MRNFVFPPTEPTSLPVLGSDALFPVRRVYCIGRNYAEHSIEMGHDPDREPPFFFQKNPNNLDPSGEFPYPANSKDVHHEAELAIMLGKGGKNIGLHNAVDHVFGYALSLDMTRRDLQKTMKDMRRPWEIGKAFERSAPVGPVHPVARVGHPTQGSLSLSVNGETRQQGDLNQMIWKIPEMISYLSEYFELAPGDVIQTGTPAGVAAVQKGDVMLMRVDGFEDLTVTVI